MTKSPKDSFDYCLEKGKEIALTNWNDNTVVTLVSTVNPVTPFVKAIRWIAKEALKKQFDQPFMVSQYNHSMDGVNRMDQNMDNYRIRVRSKKWW